MPDSRLGGESEFNFSFGWGSGKQGGAVPLRLAILGDFSGQRNGENSLSGPFRIDCDNFDEVLGRIGVALDLPPDAERAWEAKLRLRKLDHFHPEQLLTQLPPLSKLAELRSRLLRPASMEAAAKELQELLKFSALPAEPAPAISTESTEAMILRLLGKPPSEASQANSPAGLAHRLIQEIVGPNVTGVHPQQSRLAALVDAELSAGLRAVLHHPAFQALEAAWRGLDFLVRSVTEEVELSVINICESELAAMVSAQNSVKNKIHGLLEKIRPVMVLGVYTFGPESHTVLAGIARFAGSLQTAFVGGASPELVGCSSFEVQPDPDDWTKESGELQEFDALRRIPEATHLGLLMPRFLLRQPYGKRSDPIEAFPFEELTGKPEHQSYLWGNSVFLCGRLLAEAFAADPSELESGEAGEIAGLPVHQFTRDGEIQVKPCAEAWLSERAAEAILRQGIMPVVSVRGRDAVQLLTVRALSNPPRPLAVRAEFER
jgi:type VI secretion system protein ImpC